MTVVSPTKMIEDGLTQMWERQLWQKGRHCVHCKHHLNVTWKFRTCAKDQTLKWNCNQFIKDDGLGLWWGVNINQKFDDFITEKEMTL